MKSYCLKQFYIILISAIILYSAPFEYKNQPFIQPDGTTIYFNMYGDEYSCDYESVDGYTLVKNSDGFYCYARLSPDGTTLEPMNVYTSKSHAPRQLSKHLRVSSKSRQALRNEMWRLLEGISDPTVTMESKIFTPTKAKGTFWGITVLIDFPDEPATITKEEVEDYCNKKGYTANGNKGSVYDFFYDMSNKKLEYKNYVVGYYRAPKTKAYYNDKAQPFGVRARELMDGALKSIDNDFDFSKLEATNGTVRAINIMYAGAKPDEWATGLWPHKGGQLGHVFDGVKTDVYQFTSMESELTLGVFCHENGHMVCDWPDLYDYDPGDQSSRGIGKYGLMCRGSIGDNLKNPVPACAYFRDLMGWLDNVVDITDAEEGTVFKSISNNQYTTFKYRNKNNSNESFYIESFVKKGRYTLTPDHGLVIWHVDAKGSNNNQEMTPTKHYLVSIEQADGLFTIEKSTTGTPVGADGGDGDLFHKGDKTKFSDETLPDAKWWNGSNSGLDIGYVGEIGDTMEFSIGIPTGLISNTAVNEQMWSISKQRDGYVIMVSPMMNKGIFTLYNTAGKMIYTKSLETFKSNSMVLNVNNFAAGSYIGVLSVEGVNGTRILKRNITITK